MAIRILSDSAADLPLEEASRLNVTIVPLVVTIEGKEYFDPFDLSHKEFYEKLAACETLPTTSQIPPARFEDTFRPLVEGGDTVVIITVSSQLSGTYQSACIAAGEFPGKVFVFDSLSATVGQQVLVKRAVQLAAQGLEAQALVQQLEKERDSVRVLGLLDTLEYLKKGGRISAATAFAGGLLSIKPVVTVKDGSIIMAGKARGSKNGANLLRKLIGEGNGIDFSRPLMLAYTGSSDELLQAYVEDSKDLWEGQTDALSACTVGSVIGTHIGPGAIAIAYFEKDA